MAEWRGMKVKLNSPSPIRKGEPGYGRKKSKVFVMKNGKVKKIMFGDPNMKIRKNNPEALLRFVLDTNAAQLRIKQLHDIGRVELGEEREWLK